MVASTLSESFDGDAEVPFGLGVSDDGNTSRAVTLAAHDSNLA